MSKKTNAHAPKTSEPMMDGVHWRCSCGKRDCPALLTKMVDFALRTCEDGPIERYGSNIPERCVQWVKDVRMDAYILLGRMGSGLPREKEER